MTVRELIDKLWTLDANADVLASDGLPIVNVEADINGEPVVYIVDAND